MILTAVLCVHRDVAVLALPTHPVVPLLARRRWRDVARPNHKVAKVLARLSLESVLFDHGTQDREDLWLRHRFCCGGQIGYNDITAVDAPL